MKASELSGEHLGRTLIVTTDGATVRDMLTGVAHEADMIFDGVVAGQGTYSVGGRFVRLSFRRIGDLKVRPETLLEFSPDGS